jgi:hypothetical protein
MGRPGVRPAAPHGRDGVGHDIHAATVAPNPTVMTRRQTGTHGQTVEHHAETATHFRPDGNTLTVPIMRMAIFGAIGYQGRLVLADWALVAAGAVLAVGASATLPARRAGRVDLLRAIAAE